MASTTRTGLAANGAKVVYDRLSAQRQPYETRAESCALYTIPSLFPKSSDGASTDYATPWQSVGARGLNNLASKLMLAMFPINTPFFRLNLSEFQAKALVNDPAQLTKVDEGLSMVERIVMNYMEANSFRVTAFELMKQLIVAGNGLLHIPMVMDSPYSPMKLYRLSSYVVERDTYSNVLQIVTIDKIAYGALDEDIKNAVSGTGDRKPDDELTIYTHIYLDDETGDYMSYQELEGVAIEGTDGQYPKDSMPWLPVRMIKVDGEDYGRSFFKSPKYSSQNERP